MSKNLTAAARKQFAAEVKHKYQGVGKLRDCVDRVTGVVGDTHYFRLMGDGIASEKTSPSADVIPMNVTHTIPPCTLTDWEASEYTDIFNQQTVNFSERQKLAYTIASALGRREDQIIINALNGSSTTKSVAIGTTNMPVNKIASAGELMDDDEIPEGERFFIYSSSQKRSLLRTTEVGSVDYNSVKALVRGQQNDFYGFMFKMIGKNRGEGGLPVSTNDRTCFAYHRPSVGEAVGLDIRVRVDWVAQKTSHLSCGVIKAGACVVDDEGIVDVHADESAA